MSRRLILALLAGAFVLFACTNWAVPCSPARCQAAVSPITGTHSAGLAGLLVLGAITLIWILRCVWLIGSSRRALGAFPRQDAPEALKLAAERTGVRRVTFLSAPSPIAFCTGFLCPTVFISTGLLSRLEPAELDAILLHELHHAERRDPLRRILMAALQDALFFLPLVEWWIQGRVVESELAADRRALGEVGLQPLAAALWVAGDLALVPAGARFVGASMIRIAHLTGTPMPARRASRREIALSAVGLVAVAAVATCAVSALP